jgi:hypothetical protein
MILAKKNNSVCVRTKESTVIGFYRDLHYLQTNQYSLACLDQQAIKSDKLFASMG